MTQSAAMLSEEVHYHAKEIQTFLQRPRLIDNFDWTSTGTAGTVAYYNFPQVLLNDASIKNKLQNFTYFRGDPKITILVNGTAYHYGKMRMTWYPNAGPSVYTTASSAYYPQHQTLVAQTGLEGIDIYPSGANTYVLGGSFVMPIQAINIPLMYSSYTQRSNIGTFCLSVINPLIVSAATAVPVNVTIYGSFENVELTGPCATYTQTLVVDPSMAFTFVADPFFTVMPDLSSTTIPVTMQSKTEAEAKSKQGIISSTLARISQAATLFSPIPEVGPYAAAVATASAIGSTIAAVLGYSNPPTQVATTGVNYKFPDLAGGNGLFHGHTQTMNTEASNPPIHSMMASNDENYLFTKMVQKSMLQRQYTINANIANNQCLLKIPLNLESMCPKVLLTSPTRAYIGFNNLTYVANCFESWRGSIKFRFEFLCSNFQTQRLMLVYQPPNGTLVFPTITDTDAANMENKIFTVNGMHNEEFVVPFNSWQYSIGYQTGNNFTNIGCLYLLSVNNQVSSNGIPLPIYMNIYISGCDDMEFWSPKGTNQVDPAPILKTEALTSYQHKEPAERTYKRVQPQSYSTLNGAYRPSNMGNTLTGESIRSVKVMMNRPGCAMYLGSAVSPLNIEIAPYKTQMNTLPLTQAGIFPGVPYYIYFREMFRYQRGSLYATTIFGSSLIQPITALNVPNDNTTSAQTEFSVDTSSAVIGEAVNANQGFNIYPADAAVLAQFVCPYYYAFPFIPVDYSPNASTAEGYGMYTRLQIFSPPNTFLLLSAGDDFHLGYELCAPSCCRYFPGASIAEENENISALNNSQTKQKTD